MPKKYIEDVPPQLVIGDRAFTAKVRVVSSPSGSCRHVVPVINQYGDYLYAQPGRSYAATATELKRFFRSML